MYYLYHFGIIRIIIIIIEISKTLLVALLKVPKNLNLKCQNLWVIAFICP
jgi:hypothetical protein